MLMTIVLLMKLQICPGSELMRITPYMPLLFIQAKKIKEIWPKYLTNTSLITVKRRGKGEGGKIYITIIEKQKQKQNNKSLKNKCEALYFIYQASPTPPPPQKKISIKIIFLKSCLEPTNQ
jgi:hypothetical protein